MRPPFHHGPVGTYEAGTGAGRTMGGLVQVLLGRWFFAGATHVEE